MEMINLKELPDEDRRRLDRLYEKDCIRNVGLGRPKVDFPKWFKGELKDE